MTPDELDAIEATISESTAWDGYGLDRAQVSDLIAALREAWSEVERQRAMWQALDTAVRKVTAERDEAEAALDRVRALCSQNGYTTWDREKHLGEPPWRHDDPAVQAWEKAHGHDVRLKCYGEFGCRLLIDPEDIRSAIEGES